MSSNKGKCACRDNQPAYDALTRQAKQCSMNGRNKFKFAIMRAMKSLLAYPLPITCEREAMQLEGVGNYLAAEIMKALRAQGGLPTGMLSDCAAIAALPLPLAATPAVEQGDAHDVPESGKENTAPARRRQKGVRRKLPASQPSTGESPALVRQRSDDNRGFMPLETHNRNALFEDESSMLSQGSVTFDLTQGSELALEVQHLSIQTTTQTTKMTSSGSSTARNKAKSNAKATKSSLIDDMFVSPDDWAVVLIIDHRENDALLIQSHVLSQGYSCEVAQLSVGDFLWIARYKGGSQASTAAEVVLDTILERKTASDLASSIIDGRYNEQKHRLKQADLPVSLYIVEGGLSSQDRLDPASLRTAMTTTEVVHGIRVVQTRNIDHSIRILQSLFDQQIRRLPKTFADLANGSRTPLEFCDFQANYSKRTSQTVGDVFRAQLRQIPNCSTTRAAVLNGRFKTSRQLMAYLEGFPLMAGKEQVFTQLTSHTTHNQPIGPALAKYIAKFYAVPF